MYTNFVATPPAVSLLVVFTAYGAVALLAESEYFRVWSALHTATAACLFVVCLPYLPLQGVCLRKTWRISAYHRATIIMSIAFPGILAFLVALAFYLGQ